LVFVHARVQGVAQAILSLAASFLHTLWR